MRLSPLSRPVVLIAVGAALLALVGTQPAAPAPGAVQPCGNPAVDAAYTRNVMRALAAGRDLWGEALLSAAAGPTFEGAGRYLKPLLLARGPHRRKLTESGVYYVPLADPPGPGGAGAVALHVADGGQILSRRVGGPSLAIFVGDGGAERYGSCLGRLVPARLRDGYLPILETEYVDAAGAAYRQESFATRLTGTTALTSLVHVAVDARQATSDAVVRFVPSPVVARIPRGESGDVYVAWSHDAGSQARLVDEATYIDARELLARRWEQRLSEGMRITVPERRIEDADRALLVQDMILGWRYSVGNPYEEFSFPESPSVGEVMGEHGFPDVERAILETSLTRPSTGYSSWKRGERLLISAAYFRLFHDRAYVDRATATLAGYVDELDRSLGRSGPALLARERFSADIPDLVYGLHAQTVAWAGLRAMADVWGKTGHPQLAARSRRLASQLEPGLRAAVRASQRHLPDGSLFVPARLLDHETPYRSLVETRAGSYWNLVTPFAFSSGFFAPQGAEARGILRYLLRHGSRLLGLVRAGAYALYGRAAPFPVSGTDQVYGVHVARFLADADQPDQLVLSLYGQLAAGMTPGTFVAGEGASIAPLGGRQYRAMYLPPNSASNAAFLETLRLMLVHETMDTHGAPLGLELAFATPRAWLRPGRTIAVSNAPTSFGAVSFSIAAAASIVHVRIEVPQRARPARLAIRLRLPHGYRIDGVRPPRPFVRSSGTIDVSGVTGPVRLDVRYSKRG